MKGVRVHTPTREGALPVRRSLCFFWVFLSDVAKSDPRAPRLGPESSTYPKHLIEALALLRTQRIARTRSLPGTEKGAPI